MYTKTLFLLFSLLTCQLAVGQENTLDSLRQAVENMPDDSLKGERLLRISYLLYSGSEAIAYADRSLALAKRLSNAPLIGKAYAALSWAHGIGDVKKKADYIDSARLTFEAIGDLEGVAAVYNSAGAIFLEYGQLEKALDFLQKSYHIYEQTGNDNRKANALNNIGVVFLEMGQPEKAKQQYQLALNYWLTETELSPVSLGRVTFGLGSTYRALDSFEIATDFYLESCRYRLQSNKVDAAESLTSLADMVCHLQEQQQDTSVIMRKIQAAGFSNTNALLDSAMAIPGIQDRFGMVAMVLDVRRRKFLLDSNYQQAYALLDQLKRLDEEKKLSDASLEALADLQMKYEKEQLTSQLLQEEVVNQKKQNQVNILVFFLCLSVGILIIGLLIHKNRIRNNHLLLAEAQQEQQALYMRSVLEGQEKERERIARDLHDGLGNLLSTLKVNIGNLPNETMTQHQDNYHKTAAMVDEACTEVRKIAHEMMPMALKRLGLIKALEDLVEKLDRTHDFSAHFQIYGKQRDLGKSINLMLYRIVQELLNNIIKYAQAKEVLLQMTFSEEWLNLTIEDDGIGFDPQDQDAASGIGLKSVAFRVNYINGDYDIDSRPGMGTLVSINVPLHIYKSN